MKFILSAIGAALFSAMLVIPNQASAGCTLGVKDCRNGYWWVCERCGSETCMIFKNARCNRAQPPSPDITLRPGADVSQDTDLLRTLAQREYALNGSGNAAGRRLQN